PKTYTQPNLATTQSTQPNNCTPPPNTTPLKQVNKVTAEIATGKRPDPSRTRKLSLPAPMILPNPGGKVGHRRTQLKTFAPQFCWGAKAYLGEFPIEGARGSNRPSSIFRQAVHPNDRFAAGRILARGFIERFQ